MPPSLDRRPCYVLGSSRKDLAEFPSDVRADIGYALDLVRRGEEPLSAKALRGFGGRAVSEIVENDDRGTCRAVYTVRFAEIVYVLHCFQKKSVKGIATRQPDVDVIKVRLWAAEADYTKRMGGAAP